MVGHAEPKHEQVAEPERQSGEKADLRDVNGIQPVVRIDPEADGAAGEHGGADIVADRIAGEAGQRGNAIGYVLLADRAQREKIIEGQGTERAEHPQCGEPDATVRDLRQRSQDDPGIDAPQRAQQRRNREGDDEEAYGNPQPLPADPFLEATPQRGQQSMHSSSRQGGNKCGSPSQRASLFSLGSSLRQKRNVVQSLTTIGSAFGRCSRHTPYICRNAADSSPAGNPGFNAGNCRCSIVDFADPGTSPCSAS